MDIYHFADEVPVNAFISLPPLSSCTYESLRTTSYSEPGTIEVGMFIPLDHNLYSYDKFAGTLSIYDSTIKYSDLSIAVSYKLANGSQYGETPSMVWHDSIDITRPMILKLIRPRNLNSAQTVGWKLLMKNIYFIGKTEIAHTGFSLDIFRDNPNTGQSNSILGVFLLEVLGLDRFSGDEYLPDREFDFIPGITIDQSHGEIIFPNVRPFDNGIQEYFNSIGLSLPSNSEYLLPDLYDTTKVANMNSEEPLYYIRGRAVN
jgi:cell surface protein SprA